MAAHDLALSVHDVTKEAGGGQRRNRRVSHD